MTADEVIENHPFDEIRVGESASITRVLTAHGWKTSGEQIAAMITCYP